MNYSALSSGMALSPRGIGAFIMTLIIGRIVGLFDQRFLIAIGFLILAFSNFLLGNINFDFSMRNIVWPVIINGIAVSFIFVPLTTMTLGTLSIEQMGNATGIFNLMRNLGGSIGISVLITFISRGAQVHQALMVKHLSPYDLQFQQRLNGLQSFFFTHVGPWAAAPLAQGAMYRELIRQSTLWAFVDNFRYMGIACLLCIPLVFLFKKGKKLDKSAAIMAH